MRRIGRIFIKIGTMTLNTTPRNLHATAAARFRMDSIRIFVRIIRNSLKVVRFALFPIQGIMAVFENNAIIAKKAIMALLSNNAIIYSG